MFVRTAAATETSRASRHSTCQTVASLASPRTSWTDSANGWPPKAGPAVKTAASEVSTTVTVARRRVRGRW